MGIEGLQKIKFYYFTLSSDLRIHGVNIHNMYVLCVSLRSAIFPAGLALASRASRYAYYIFGPHKLLKSLRYRFKEKSAHFQLPFPVAKMAPLGETHCMCIHTYNCYFNALIAHTLSERESLAIKCFPLIVFKNRIYLNR